MVALARYGGLRVPSEALALRLSDIDWGDDETPGHFTVRSVKTEHIAGKATRIVPMFPELRPFLLESFELAHDGAEFVISRYRDSTANLRTQFQRIITRAGVEPWPRLWQNLRASRETELVDELYPIQAVTSWIGNSPRIAQRHYLQVTDEHFKRAAGARNDGASEMERQVMQNPMHQGAASGLVEPQTEPANPTDAQGSALAGMGMGGTGFEPV